MKTPHDDRSPSDQREIARMVSTASKTGRVDGISPRKRGTDRFLAGMQLDVTTDPDDAEQAWAVSMHNISDSGFAFWSKRQVRTDSAIQVREFSGEEPNPWLAARVTHCTVGIRGYLVGARFDTDG